MPFVPQWTEQSWGQELLVAHGPTYTGKVLFRFASPPHHRGGLQFHRSKDETFYLHSGEVWVYFVDEVGVLRKVHMIPGMSFHVPPGAIHSVETITDSVMFEASNPVFDDRVRVEEQYDVSTAVEVNAATWAELPLFIQGGSEWASSSLASSSSSQRGFMRARLLLRGRTFP